MADPGPGEVVDAINAAWVGGRAEELVRYLHPDVLVVTPELETVALGADACVRSYQQYAGETTVLDYREDGRQVTVEGGTAVVSYHYRVSWAAPGGSGSDGGREVFVLDHGRDGWRVVWRMMLLDDSG